MADPILPDFFRAQVVLSGHSGLPEDVFTNSFVFRNDSTLNETPVPTRIGNALGSFYNAIQGFLTSVHIKPEFVIKVYDLGQAKPRLPVVVSKTFGGLSGSSVIPSEVAACLSYYAGRPLPRRRGRIYLGPLANSALTSTAGSGVRLNQTFIDAAKAAAAVLASGNGQGVQWHVLSQRDQAAHAITGGWMDNAPDTQHRRGLASNLRTNWGAPPTV